MHLFSTRSWHIVHWDPCNYHCVSRVFIFFYLQVWNSGVWCFDFDFSLGFTVLSLFCIITTLVFFMISFYHCCLSRRNSCQTLPTYSSLWAVILWLAESLWAPVLFMQEKHLKSNIPPDSKWQWRCQEELDSGQSHIHSDNCRQLFHMDPCWIIKPW